ncbi:hypothetical protein EJB05_29653, partial [Eragrostis curvula]
MEQWTCLCLRYWYRIILIISRRFSNRAIQELTCNTARVKCMTSDAPRETSYGTTFHSKKESSPSSSYLSVFFRAFMTMDRSLKRKNNFCDFSEVLKQLFQLLLGNSLGQLISKYKSSSHASRNQETRRNITGDAPNVHLGSMRRKSKEFSMLRFFIIIGFMHNFSFFRILFLLLIYLLNFFVLLNLLFNLFILDFFLFIYFIIIKFQTVFWFVRSN